MRSLVFRGAALAAVAALALSACGSGDDEETANGGSTGSEVPCEQDGVLKTKRLTQQEIADMVGASRAMVSRILKDLKTGGYIDIEKKCIIIHQKLPSHW